MKNKFTVKVIYSNDKIDVNDIFIETIKFLFIKSRLQK